MSNHLSEMNNTSNQTLDTVLDRMRLQSQTSESSSRPLYSAASAVTSMDGNQLESVIDNYNRINTQSAHNVNANWMNSFFELMKSEWTRLRSYHARQSAKWTVESVLPEDLARAGFFFLNGDRVQCAFCRGIVSNWESGGRPLAEHARHFPRCPFIMGEDVGNQPIEDDPIRGPKRHFSAGYDVCGNFTPNELHGIGVNDRNAIAVQMNEYGIQPHRGPKHPNYKSIDARLRTFMSSNWRPTVPIDTGALAEAGFFSIGVSDHVKCFYCDLGLVNWELGDEPWIEHAKNLRTAKDCQFVTLNKSQTFIDECRRLNNMPEEEQHSSNSEEVSDPELYSPVGSDNESEDMDQLAVNEWMNSDIVLQVLDLNAFSTDVIKSVLYKRWREERQPFTSFAHLYDAASQWREPQTIQMIRRPVLNSDSENEYLNSISSEEEYNSGNELPASQSSVSSTASTLSTYSSSPPETEQMPTISESSEGSPKTEDNRLLCKICLDREIGVVFLPCGHQLACTQCAPCVTDCPICRKVIRGTVRTFFS